MRAKASSRLTKDKGSRLILRRAATLRPANGGVLTLSPVATPIFAAPRGQSGGGALSLTALGVWAKK